jgi:hypothetical protein
MPFRPTERKQSGLQVRRRLPFKEPLLKYGALSASKFGFQSAAKLMNPDTFLNPKPLTRPKRLSVA